MSDSERTSSDRVLGSSQSGHQASPHDDSPSPSVLDALGDSACRCILREINDPMSAQEIAKATELPLSSTYRKLDFLVKTGLLTESTEVRADGNHSSLYLPDFEAVRIVVDQQRQIDVSISRTDAGHD